MNTSASKNENGELIIALNGKIDSANAAGISDEIDGYTSDFSGNIIIDAEELVYISSAGLRIILRLRKNCPELKIINANSEVYEILDMTGFTEMMTVEKAYRKLSVEGCEVIGTGANGTVYRLDRDTIIKVYNNPDCLPDIHRERELARKAFVLGVPTAIPYDVARVGQSYGSVFELLNAKSFTKILAAEPDRLDEIAKLSVELLKKIHTTEVKPGDMPDMRSVTIDWVEFLKDYLPEDTYEKLLGLIKAVPVSHKMIHGDYHTKNVMVQNGEVLLIDMDTLSQGDPVFEFASIFNAYCGFYTLEPEIRGSFIGLTPEVSEEFWHKTLEYYFDTQDAEKLALIEEKASLVGYTRLMRRLIRRGGLETESGRNTIEFYKSRIVKLTEKLDALTL